MFQETIENFKEKSLKERFLFVIGLLFFLMYFVLGITVILWENFPIVTQTNYRIAFGVILILYAILRFIRFFNANKD